MTRKAKTNGDAATIQMTAKQTAQAAAQTTAQATQARRGQIRSAAILLKQAADPTRLEILLNLSTSERHVGGICEDLGGLSQPSISHHLALLRAGRLIEPRRSGKSNYYKNTDLGQKLAFAVQGLTESGNGHAAG